MFCPCIIVDPDPAPDIAFCHALCIKVITVCKNYDKDRDLCSLFRIPGIMQIQLLVRIIQLEIDTRVTLDMKSQLFGIRPFAVASAVLAVTQQLLSVYNAYSIVLLL